MLSAKCIGVLTWHISLFIRWAYGDNDIAIATTQAPLIPEYKNPYPINSSCYRFADITNKEFYSPAYPPDAPTYPSNINCSVVITAPENQTVELDFLDYFKIEESDGCKNDYLEVRDGRYGFSTVLLRYCGVKGFPPKIRSSDRYLWVYFQSDENIEYQGFRAVFSFVPRSNGSGTPESMECKTEIENLQQGRFGREDIDSKIIEYDSQHGLPIDCMWVISVTPTWRIQLQFEKFELLNPNECEMNFVEVFSNNTMNSRQKFCGSIAETVLSDPSHNVIIVRFFADKLGETKPTFTANFTAFRATGEGKFCQEGEFDCEDETCISSDLVCNGVFNCRFKSDENECESSEPKFTDEHIVIIMVIFSLILTGMFFTFIYNCIKKLLRDHKTIKDFRLSMEQLDKQESQEKASYKGNGNARTPSVESTRFGASESVNTPCYVPGEDILPILIKHNHKVNSPPNGSMYNQDIYGVDEEPVPKMCDSACQTRESLFTTQEYSSGTSSPTNTNSMRTNSPQAPFSTFGYGKKEPKCKAEAKIDMHHHEKSLSPYDKRYSVQTTKSAPDVIVTH